MNSFPTPMKAAPYCSQLTPDREGEAISWHLAYILNVDPTSTCRITFNEITKNAVAEALNLHVLSI